MVHGGEDVALQGVVLAAGDTRARCSSVRGLSANVDEAGSPRCSLVAVARRRPRAPCTASPIRKLRIAVRAALEVGDPALNAVDRARRFVRVVPPFIISMCAIVEV